MAWEVECGANDEITHNFSLRQGDHYLMEIDFGAPITGIVVRGEVRTDYQPDGTDVFDLTVTTIVTDQTFQVKVLPTDSAALSVGASYVYDIEWEIAAQALKKTFVVGTITVKPQVSA
jgi:hypothetical protein